MNQTINDKIAQQKKVLADLKKEQVAAQKKRAKDVAEYVKYKKMVEDGKSLFKDVIAFERDCLDNCMRGAERAENFSEYAFSQNADADTLETIYDMLGLTDDDRILYNAYVKKYKEEHADDDE